MQERYSFPHFLKTENKTDSSEQAPISVLFQTHPPQPGPTILPKGIPDAVTTLAQSLLDESGEGWTATKCTQKSLHSYFKHTFQFDMFRLGS